MPDLDTCCRASVSSSSDRLSSSACACGHKRSGVAGGETRKKGQRSKKVTFVASIQIKYSARLNQGCTSLLLPKSSLKREPSDRLFDLIFASPAPPFAFHTWQNLGPKLPSHKKLISAALLALLKPAQRWCKKRNAKKINKKSPDPKLFGISKSSECWRGIKARTPDTSQITETSFTGGFTFFFYISHERVFLWPS